MTLREYDVVRVTRLAQGERPFNPFKIESPVLRPPKVGDAGTIVHVYDPDNPDAPFVVEAVAPDACTIWLEDFLPSELELVWREGRNRRRRCRPRRPPSP